MSYFMRNGNRWTVSDSAAVDIHTKLPAGNYIIKEDQYGNLFLESIDAFERPSKVYGDSNRNADRILRTFADRSSSTGVMLTGEKGSGKTMLAKNLSIACADLDIPTIVINSPWKGDSFNQLLQDIQQPCMVLFDEFEKVYCKDAQEHILTLLDGVFPSKKLFVLTCNDKWRVDSHMRNRPGRIFYMLDFTGLDVEFIREYCADNLKDLSHVDSICKISGLFDQFNFDMLKALIEEMNRYGESPQDALRMINAKPEYGDRVEYDLEVAIDSAMVEKDDFSPNRWNGNPLSSQVYINYNDSDKEHDDDDDDDNWKTVIFEQKHLVKIDPEAGKFVFKRDGKQVVLTRCKPTTFDYLKAF